MDKLEKLILEQALYKMVGDDVGTRDPHNLRGEADAYYRDMFEQTGAKSFTLRLNGQDVGTYSVKTSKGSADTCREVFVPDLYALSDWDLGGLAERYALAHIADYAEFYFRETGEMPPGCSIGYEVTAGVPAGTYMGGALKVEPSKVLDAMRDSLPDAVAGLFEGESDE